MVAIMPDKDLKKVETEEAPTEAPKSLVDEAREERLLLEKTHADIKAENDRTELLMAKRELGGHSEAGQVVEKKVETAEEYAERVNRGEANPLHEDNYI